MPWSSSILRILPIHPEEFSFRFNIACAAVCNKLTACSNPLMMQSQRPHSPTAGPSNKTGRRRLRQEQNTLVGCAGWRYKQREDGANHAGGCCSLLFAAFTMTSPDRKGIHFVLSNAEVRR
jgi:hypothetical protein